MSEPDVARRLRRIIPLFFWGLLSLGILLAVLAGLATHSVAIGIVVIGIVVIFVFGGLVGVVGSVVGFFAMRRPSQSRHRNAT